MTDRSEFVETTYERPLYDELKSDWRVWTPGPVLEAHVGFDTALFVANTFWSMVGRPACEGARLIRHGLSPMVRRIFTQEDGTPIKPPDFSLNLFVQAKRPFRFRDAPQKVIERGLARDSFFCDVTDPPHQQGILENLASGLGNSADVTYACAAFLDLATLWSLQEQRRLVENSTFPPVAKLKGHERWVYDRPGADGVALSEPEAVQAPSLFERIAELASRHPPSAQTWALEYEESLSKAQHDKLVERRAGDLVPNLRHLWQAFSHALSDVADEDAEHARSILEQALAVDDDLPEYVRLMVKISTAAARLDVAWLVVGPERK